MSPTTTEVKTAVERREILGPAGNRVREVEEQKKKKDGVKKAERGKKLGAESPKPGPVVVRSTGAVDRSGSSTLKKLNSKGRVNGNANKPAKVVPDGAVAMSMSPIAPVPLKRCDWITPNTGNLVLIRSLLFLIHFFIMLNLVLKFKIYIFGNYTKITIKHKNIKFKNYLTNKYSKYDISESEILGI